MDIGISVDLGCCLQAVKGSGQGRNKDKVRFGDLSSLSSLSPLLFFLSYLVLCGWGVGRKREKKVLEVGMYTKAINHTILCCGNLASQVKLTC